MRARDILSIVGCALLAFAPVVAAAQSVSNPAATLSIVGDDTVIVAPGAPVENAFTVRVVDVNGSPLPNVGTDFNTYGAGHMDLQRATMPAGLTCP